MEWGGGCARHHLIDPLIAASALRGAGLDWKTSLQELLSQHDLGNPTYQVDGADRSTPGSPLGWSSRALSGAPVRGGPGTPNAGCGDRLGSGSAPSMPELPEVEVVRRGLADHVAGRRIASVRCAGRVARRHVAGHEDPIGLLTGRVIGRARRRGKYRGWSCRRCRRGPVEDALLLHLGMSG